jgi:hypothetical protein
MLKTRTKIKAKTKNKLVMDTIASGIKQPFLKRVADGAIAFVSAPASARPLAFFRIGVAAVLLLQGFWLAGNLLELYGRDGIVQWEITDQLIPDGVPRLSWVANMLKDFGVSADDAVRLVFLVYMASLACLLIGWRTRFMAGAAWLTHLAMHSTGGSTSYGVDQFANIGLFYSIWMPVGDCASVDRYTGRFSGAPSAAARLSLRVLQIHLCIVYWDAGFEKAFAPGLLKGVWNGDWLYADWWSVQRVNPGWWNGESFWVSIMQSDFGPFDFSWLAEAPWLAMLACWGTLAVELGYPFLVWPRRTRKLWVLLTIGMHVGIALTLWLWSFALMLIVYNATSFIVSPEPEPKKGTAETNLPTIEHSGQAEYPAAPNQPQNGQTAEAYSKAIPNRVR